MTLADKMRYLREVEGSLRGLGRAMTQGELLRALAAETGGGLSQSYLSQIESGARPHLTNTTRLKLAKFFKVHPGYLVDDPPGYHPELLSDVRLGEDALDLWIVAGAERFRRDAELRRALLTISRHPDSRRCLLLLESILDTDGLADRLLDLLRPAAKEAAPAYAASTLARAGDDALAPPAAEASLPSPTRPAATQRAARPRVSPSRNGSSARPKGARP